MTLRIGWHGNLLMNLNAITDYWPELNQPHLRYDDIQPVIQALSQQKGICAEVVDRSYLGVPIHKLTLGSGPVKIFAWTQMHGDEPTATAAVFDLISHLVDDNASLPFDAFAQQFSLHVVPMLNPDGAEANTRFNAQGIDINRDAVAMQSPEGRLLRRLVDELQPDIAFNLHDQNPYYSAGDSSTPATIAFLAPAYDVSKSINPSRARAMQLIAVMRHAVEQHIPSHVARYNDDYSYRSFGDKISSLGASTILIESGAYRSDPNRQRAREMNVVALLSAIEALADDSWKSVDCDDYFAIPENIEDGLCSLLITNAQLRQGEQHAAYLADISIVGSGTSATIKHIGDLSNCAGFEQIDAGALALSTGNPYHLNAPFELEANHYKSLLRDGVTHFVGDATLLQNRSGLPVLVVQHPLTHILPEQVSCLLCSSRKGPTRPMLAIIGNNVISLAD
ncbi:M14 family zinc carboxypeptidase [Alteromonas oceanisediminis]|uniref:M14 family zinc carboxypeptidase n=1 Tax=Alteromonas oceanisediminis TaxID=2836180 RepID=UPI001BD9B2FF|nr:M14 family zinc carboxypeptidase [Alteromonas oceanisediminis]MBT0585945.1 peptidase M14 [Alteromonas oceanisediminis]